MKRIITFSLFSLIVVIFLSSCTSIKTTTESECTQRGLKYENKKTLNYRSGKYVMKTICIENK